MSSKEMNKLFDILETQYLPALRLFRSKTFIVAPCVPVDNYPLILGCNNIGSELHSNPVLYHLIFDFYDQCIARDGYDWINQTIGMNLYFYQLLKLRYLLMYSIRDYKKVHYELPEDATQYAINILTSEFPTDECRSTF
jgi:hypothetical protein